MPKGTAWGALIALFPFCLWDRVALREPPSKTKHYPKAAAAVDGWLKQVLDLQDDPILKHAVEDLATGGTANQRSGCVNANPFGVGWCWSRDFCPSARCFCDHGRPSKKAKEGATQEEGK